MIVHFLTGAFRHAEFFIEIMHFMGFIIKLVIDVEKSVIGIFYLRRMVFQIVNIPSR